MMFVSLATEDELSEAIGLRLLAELPTPMPSPQCLRRNGFGYLRSRMGNWRQMAQHQVVVVLTDLDKKLCPLALRADWLGDIAMPENLLLRIAVREVESWVLADHEGMRELIGSKGALPSLPDDLPDPKQYLLRLAKNAPRTVRDDLVKEDGAMASQGIGYNARLTSWIHSVWDPQRAAERSPSLQRTRLRLTEMAVRIAAAQ